MSPSRLETKSFSQQTTSTSLHKHSTPPRSFNISSLVLTTSSRKSPLWLTSWNSQTPCGSTLCSMCPSSIYMRTLPPLPVTIDNALEYIVEKILDHHTCHCHLEYLVKWAGHPDHDTSWELLKHLTNAQEILHEYKALWTMPEEGGSNVMESQSQPQSRDHQGKPRTRNNT